MKLEIIKFVKRNNIKAGCILTCVGCLTKATLRMAGAKQNKDFSGEYEIVSVVGTLSVKDVHLHMSISDGEGNVFGGHMKNGCVVDTTAEIVIGEPEGYEFSTELDNETGYDELVVKHVE